MMASPTPPSSYLNWRGIATGVRNPPADGVGPRRGHARFLMPFYPTSPYLLPIVLLLCSNLFMTIAWYGHLRFKAVPLFGVILASWGIAFIEYCFAVPANRY